MNATCAREGCPGTIDNRRDGGRFCCALCASLERAIANATRVVRDQEGPTSLAEVSLSELENVRSAVNDWRWALQATAGKFG